MPNEFQGTTNAWDAVGGPPCPRCGTQNILGVLLVTEDGSHQHTWYICRFWRSGTQADGSPYIPTERCGWTGYSVPGWNRT